jgi:4-amino-4-deoxy-L-arabinose transferase-like glycosyltransferase
LVYLVVTLDGLAVFPPVGQDEPWIAAAPYKLATEGVYGSDLFAGYYGVDRHNYQHPPLFPLLEALVFRAAGVGVYQMRFLPVAFGALLLAATFLVGSQAGGTRTGLLAAVLLLALRLGAGHDETGVPLLDSGRINRYDIAVPVFGLLALSVFNRAAEQPGPKAYLLAGVLIGLASLSHLYGIFWLPSLWLIGWFRHGWRYWRRREPYLLLAGIGAAWLPWFLFIASGWQDFRGQARFMADRFDILNPHFYIENLVHEIDRYQGLDLRSPAGWPYLDRPGAWLAICGIPVAVAVLGWQGWKQRDWRSSSLAVAFVTQSLLFAALLKVKSDSYLIALWPLAVLCLAWLGVWIWNRGSKRWARMALLALLCLVLLEGAGRIAHRRAVIARTTPYDQLAAQIAELLPPGACVLGLQHYWLGLHAYPFRTWLLPVLYAMPEYYTPALAMDEALERVDPDVILLDPPMRAYFDELAGAGHPRHALYRGFQRFMVAHNAAVLGVIEDATYGTLVVYGLEDPEPSQPGDTAHDEDWSNCAWLQRQRK